MIDNLSFLSAVPSYKLMLMALSIAGIAFFRVRAGSSYLLLDRLLRGIFGKAPIYHAGLRKIIRETHDLEQLRIRFRLRVMNTPSLNRLIEWTERHGVSLHELSQMHDYVKPEDPRIVVPPPKSQLVASVIVICFLILWLSTAATMISTPAALETSKNTGQTYLMSLTHGERFALFAPQLTTESCIATPPGNDADRELCTFLDHPRYKEFVSAAIHDQQKFGLLFLLLNLPLTWLFTGDFHAARRAIKLSNRLGKNIGSTEQIDANTATDQKLSTSRDI